MLDFTFFVFLNFVFLVLSVLRTIYLYKEKYDLEKSLLTKIGTLILIYLLGSLYFYKESGRYLFLTLNFSLILFYVLLMIAKKHKEKSFEKEFSLFLNNIILQMQIGIGFRTAFLASKKLFSDSFNKKADKIMEYVVFSQQKQEFSSLKWLEEAIGELKSVDQEPFNGLNRLVAYVDKQKTLSNFRRRSGQITLQIRLQVLVMTIMYLGLLFLSHYFFETKLSHQPLVVSLVLYLSGLYFVFRIKKGFKWKV